MTSRPFTLPDAAQQAIREWLEPIVQPFAIDRVLSDEASRASVERLSEQGSRLEPATALGEATGKGFADA